MKLKNVFGISFKNFIIFITVAAILVLLKIVLSEPSKAHQVVRSDVIIENRRSRATRVVTAINPEDVGTSSQIAEVGGGLARAFNIGDLRSFHDESMRFPQDAIEFVEKNLGSIDPSLRERYAMAALDGIARVSPELALQWVNKSKIFPSERIAVTTIFGAWDFKNEDDVKLALKHASLFKDRDWSDAFIPSTVEALAEYSTVDALDWVSAELKDNLEMYRRGLQGVFLQIAQKEPRDFWKLVSGFESDPIVTKAASIALINLSIRNIDAAEDLLSEIRTSGAGGFVENIEVYTSTIDSIAQQNITRNPDKVLNLLLNSGINEKKAYELFGNNMFNWIRESPERAIEWLTSRNAPEKTTFLSNLNVVTAIAELSPERAVRTIEQGGLTGEEAIRGYNSTLQVWGAKSPGDAFKWISSQDSSIQIGVINGFVEGMFSVAPDIVDSYLSSGGITAEARDQGVVRLSQLGPRK